MRRARDVSAQLVAMQKRKRELDEDLERMERQIYELEGAYLEETQHVGNVLRGWDSFLSSKPAPSKAGAVKKARIKDSDRLFSLSSVTSPASLATQGQQAPVPAREEEEAGSESKGGRAQGDERAKGSKAKRGSRSRRSSSRLAYSSSDEGE